MKMHYMNEPREPFMKQALQALKCISFYALGMLSGLYIAGYWN